MAIRNLATHFVLLVSVALVTAGSLSAQEVTSPFARGEKLPGDLSDLLRAVDRAAPKQSEPPEKVSPDAPAAKAAIPPAAAQQEAVRLIAEVFGRPTKPKEMIALSAKLIKTGLDDKDPANKYALFRRAGELALAAGDVRAAAKSVDLLGRHFEIDTLSMKAALAEHLAGRAKSDELLAFAAAQFDAALVADHFAVARRFGLVGYQAAVAARDKDSIAAMRERAAALGKRKAAFDTLKTALAVLKTDPDAAAANLQVGQYLAYLNGDWQRGLPLLVKGGHPIAKQEAAAADDAAAQRKLADIWWEFAETKTAPAAGHIKQRAAHWYRKALPHLAGFHKVKAQKRLEEITTSEQPVGADAVNSSTSADATKADATK